MQQRLAVASILVLVLLAGASAVLIAHNAYSQTSPKASNQAQSNHDSPSSLSSSSTTGSSTNSTSGGSLLTTANHTMTGDDGNETEHETETETSTGVNSTLDD